MEQWTTATISRSCEGRPCCRSRTSMRRSKAQLFFFRPECRAKVPLIVAAKITLGTMSEFLFGRGMFRVHLGDDS